MSSNTQHVPSVLKFTHTSEFREVAANFERIGSNGKPHGLYTDAPKNSEAYKQAFRCRE